MVSFLLVAALLAAGEQSKPADNAQASADLRTFCTAKSKITKGGHESGVKSDGVSFTDTSRRAMILKNGQRVVVQKDKGREQLILEKDGQYRVIVDGQFRVHQLVQSPEGKMLAVAVVYKDHTELFRAPTAGVYLFDTDTWVGDQVVKFIGLSGLAWSPDGKVLAYGDGSKLRFYDVANGEVLETCGIDSMATADNSERLQTVRWVADRRIEVTYQNPNGTADFLVERK